MTILETLASPPMPVPINWIEAFLAVVMIVGCFRRRQRFSDEIKENKIFYPLLFSSGPLVLTTLFGVFHAWSIFSFSERDRAALLLCAFCSTYNLMIGMFAFVVNTTLITHSIKKQKKSEQTGPANHRPFGTSGMSSADSAPRAEATPEASGDS